MPPRDLRHAGAWPGRRAGAADKAFKRDDLADSADQAGGTDQERGGRGQQVGRRPLRTDADAAFRRNDFRGGLHILGQIAATTPEDGANWLRARQDRLPDPLGQLQRTDLPDGARLDRGLYRLSACRQSGRGGRCAGRAGQGDRRAQAVASGASTALRLSLDMREVADVRGQYEKMRDEHGFRLLDYTVDSDSASPRACFQFSEELAKRVDFAPFLALAGTDKPALSTRRQAALRRRAEARRALQHQSARRPAVDRQGTLAEIGRVQHLCPRPQAVRALHRPRLCAAADRPARHPGGQRQHPGGHDRRCSGSATAT